LEGGQVDGARRGRSFEVYYSRPEMLSLLGRGGEIPLIAIRESDNRDSISTLLLLNQFKIVLVYLTPYPSDDSIPWRN
jgi:hypothetical protein